MESRFTKKEIEELKQAIADAEKNSSAEIKVHIESSCNEDVYERAVNIFNKLEMFKTKLRNGVLIYLAIDSKHFAIIGDIGINDKVGETFWVEIKNKAIECFKDNRYTDGLIIAIKESGIALKEHFPYETDDVNELSDDISFGKTK